MCVKYCVSTDNKKIGLVTYSLTGGNQKTMLGVWGWKTGWNGGGEHARHMAEAAAYGICTKAKNVN